MCIVRKFAFSIIQFVLLFDITKQSKVKQGINILKTIGSTIKKPISKTIGNTIKNSIDMFSQKTNKNGLKSLVNMVSKNKPQLPFLFATGGFMKLNEMSLVPENDIVEEIPVSDKLSSKTNLKFFDVAANLSDDMFKGIYNGKQFHQGDFDHVIKRANAYGVNKFLFVGRYLEDTLALGKLCEGRSDCWTTVGVHPCRTSNIEKDGGTKEDYYEKMENTILTLGKDKVAAIGECGLDFNRQKYSNKETQLKYFPMHFDLAEKFKLPMYFNSRNNKGNFMRIVKENRHRFPGGVVHSFTGSEEDLNGFLDLGLYISVNGASLKTDADLEIVKKIPLDRIMLESNCPYCEIRISYASKQLVKTIIPRINNKKNWNPDVMIRNRNEPCKVIQVAEAIAAIKGISEEELANAAYENSNKMFTKEE